MLRVMVDAVPNTESVQGDGYQEPKQKYSLLHCRIRGYEPLYLPRGKKYELKVHKQLINLRQWGGKRGLTFTHSCTHRRQSQPRKATASSSGAARVRGALLRDTSTLSQEELGIEPATSRLPANPHFPPEPQAQLVEYQPVTGGKASTTTDLQLRSL
jgi:hypothetical protein